MNKRPATKAPPSSSTHFRGMLAELVAQLTCMRDASLISAEEFERIVRGFRTWASWSQVMVATTTMSGLA